jgi:hypothetical protein
LAEQRLWQSVSAVPQQTEHLADGDVSITKSHGGFWRGSVPFAHHDHCSAECASDVIVGEMRRAAAIRHSVTQISLIAYSHETAGSKAYSILPYHISAFI